MSDKPTTRKQWEEAGITEDILRQARQIPKADWIRDFTMLLQRVEIPQGDLLHLLQIIKNRLESKSCVRCRKLKVMGVEMSFHCVEINHKAYVYNGEPLCFDCMSVLNYMSNQ